MFDLSDQQKDIRQAAREFAEGEFPDIAQECDEKEIFPIDAWKEAGQSGFLGVFIDERFKGAGLGILDYAILLEEFWRVDPGCGNILLSTLGSEFIQDYGSEEQKTEYLPPLTKAEALMGVVAGQDHAYEDFQYTKNDGKEYILNGSSRFVFNGSTAAHLVVVAQNGASIGKFTTFIVERWRPGIKTTKLCDKLGVRASDVAEVILADVTVPSANIIGIEGQGREQLDAFLEKLSIYNSAQAVGASQGCLEKAIRYSRQRVQFGRPIGWFHMVQFKISEMAARLEAARTFCYEAALGFDQGRIDRKVLSMASWFSREAASLVTAETLQIHGGYGYMKDLDVERFYRDVQFLELFGTSRENEKMRTAQILLGKLE